MNYDGVISYEDHPCFLCLYAAFNILRRTFVQILGNETLNVSYRLSLFLSLFW